MVAAILAVASISLGAPEWAAGSAGVANAGVATTGVVAITGVAATTGTATIGTTGMAIGAAIMSSSSATSAFHGGGVGVGVRHGATLTAATDMVDTAADTATDMDTTADTAMDMDTATPATVMAPATVMDTASAADPEWPSYSAGSLEPVITTGPLTAFWDRRRVEQFGLTSAIAGMQTDEVSLRVKAK